MKAVIKINNERGRAALLWAFREETEFRQKARRMPFKTKRVKLFLKTKSVMKEDRQEITGFEHFTEKDQVFFKEQVAKAMKENGAETQDYEVYFENDGEQKQ